MLAEFGKGLASFTGNPDVFVYLSVQDPASPAPTGFNETNVVSVWGRSGRFKASSRKEKNAMGENSDFRKPIPEKYCYLARDLGIQAN